jgi:ketosteroid isomerase-like protein
MTSFFPAVLLISMTMASQTGSAQTPPGPAAGAQKSSLNGAVKEWYAAWEKKDWNLLEQTLADGFRFSSPLDDHIDVKRFKERCWPNAHNIKRFDLEKVVASGDDVFVISDGWTMDGKLFRNCDCFKLKDGKIGEYECFFGPGVNFPNSGK